MLQVSHTEEKTAILTGEGIDFPEIKSGPSLKSILGVFGAIIAAFLVYYLLSDLTAAPGSTPDTHALSKEGLSLAAVFAVALVLWVTEAIPIAVTSLFALILAPLLGVVPSIKFSAVGFTSPVVFFVIAAYCLAAAIVDCGIGWRFALWLINRTGTSPKRALLGVMCGTALISALISDVPACAIFMALTLPILSKINATPGQSNLGKVMMIGIPMAALIGGVATPAGSSINIIALELLKSEAGLDVTFLQWMALGLPLTIIIIPVAWFILLKIFPPEVESIGDISEFKKELRTMGSLKDKEKNVLIILSILIVLWVSSSWIKQLDVATVSICGAVAMFLPGINILNWKKVQDSIGWDTVLMIGTATSLGILASNTGLSTWMVTNVLGDAIGWNMVLLIGVISAFTVVVHLPLPLNPAVNAVLIPAMALLAIQTGNNPALFAMPVAFTASCNFLLPLEAVPLVTYSKGYYRMFDMLKPGILVSVAWVIIMTALMFTVAPIVGLR